MARLPGDRYLIQQIDGIVILFEEGSEREIVRVPLWVKPETGERVINADGIAKAQKVIHDAPELTDEEKCFAHFWSGYFYGCAAGG